MHNNANSITTIIRKMQFVNFMSEGSNRLGQHSRVRNCKQLKHGIYLVFWSYP